MFEVLPVIGGLGAGFVVGGMTSGWLRWAGILVSGVIVGSLVALVSGELAESLGFLLVDVPVAVLAATVGAALARVREPAERPAE